MTVLSSTGKLPPRVPAGGVPDIMSAVALLSAGIYLSEGKS